MSKADIAALPKLTKARQRVLKDLERRGGAATEYDLGYPRSHMMHHLVMGGFVQIYGPINAWGGPSHSGGYSITDAGRKALSDHSQT